MAVLACCCNDDEDDANAVLCVQSVSILMQTVCVQQVRALPVRKVNW